MRDQSHSRPFDDRRRLCLGIDVGSIACKIVVTDFEGNLLDHSYTRTLGKPVQCAAREVDAMLARHAGASFDLAVGTGSVGRLLCELLGIPSVNEVMCQAVAVKRLRPEVRTLIEMGGQDSKLLFLPEGDGREQPLRDFTMNTNCAAGTGSFLDQQASRMRIRVEDEFAALALKSTNPPTVAGRCSVFAKSDMIHLQQKATPDYDILMGLCVGLARNLKSNLARGRDVDRPIAFCGGVASNAAVVRAFEMVFELPRGGLIVPPEHAVTGAYGAVLLTLRNGGAVPLPPNASDILHSYAIEEQAVGYRLKPLRRPEQGYPDNRVWLDEVLREQVNGDPIDAYLGLDIGSISTKIAVVDRNNRVLAKSYLMTEGRPLEAVRRCLRLVGEQLPDRVRIVGAATTGSGRYLTGDFVGADLVVNEITAQAHAAALIDPNVDTVFEIGGQDSKYISLSNGVVVDFEMNHACAAGTGSFIEEQAERLDINIENQFSEMALGSTGPVRLGERCTVFMESDLLSCQQRGARTDDLVAGLAYSIVSNYINRVVGRRQIGKHIFFQGGTAFNKGVVAAFEAVTGKTVTVPPHHEVTGSIGAAALARKYQEEHGRTESNFRGFDVSTVDYHIRSFECEHCSNACMINEVTVPGREPLYYGAKCDRYEVNKNAAANEKIPNLFNERFRLLKKHASLPESPRPGAPTIGIPLALSNHQLLPFWGTLLGRLGLNVVLSGASTKKVVRRGVEAVQSTPCFPVKVAHGHVLELIDKGVDYIWMPSILSMWQDDPATDRNQLCPYVQAIPYQVAVAVEPDRKGVKMLKLPVRFGDGEAVLRASLEPLCREFGVSGRQLRDAIAAADAAQRAFEKDCIARGRQALADRPAGQRAVVIISRPYNGCDPGVSLDLPNKLRKLGVLPVPMDLLDLLGEDVSGDHVFSNMYWKYGQRILRAARIVRRSPGLNAVFLSNFSCGPDSFLLSYFKRIMADRPSLVLEIDEHSADAGVVTRLEAFLESLANARMMADCPAPTLYEHKPVACDQRTIYVPWMSDAAHGLVAAFRACGQPAEVLSLATDESLELGRRHTTGKECLPCIVTTGDMLLKCREEGFDPNRAAFFMPGGSGPCRFGQYNCFHKILLNEAGLPDIPVIAPNQDKQFYRDFSQFAKNPTRLAWIAINAIDTFTKALLHIRPYEVVEGETNRVYERARDGLCRLIESNPPEEEIYLLIDGMADTFRAVDVDRSVPKPRIGIVGEIYVRTHTFSNRDLIHQLERLGAEVDLASISEWMYYTNFTRNRTSWRERTLGLWVSNKLTNHVQKRIERRITRQYRSFLPNAVEPNVVEVLRLAKPYIHHSFEGEACLSVGKMVEYCEHGCDGLVNVMPFSCMPSTIVAGLMKMLSEDHQGIPAISIAYDGQADPTLDTRLEAFVMQADAYRRARAHGAGRPHPVVHA